MSLWNKNSILGYPPPPFQTPLKNIPPKHHDLTETVMLICSLPPFYEWACSLSEQMWRWESEASNCLDSCSLTVTTRVCYLGFSMFVLPKSARNIQITFFFPALKDRSRLWGWLEYSYWIICCVGCVLVESQTRIPNVEFDDSQLIWIKKAFDTFPISQFTCKQNKVLLGVFYQQSSNSSS